MSANPAPQGNFDDLWKLGLGGVSQKPSTAVAVSSTDKSIKDLEKDKANAGIWGISSKPAQDLFGAPSAPTPTSVKPAFDDDLLL
jgi:epsin